MILDVVDIMTLVHFSFMNRKYLNIFSSTEHVIEILWLPCLLHVTIHFASTNARYQNFTSTYYEWLKLEKQELLAISKTQSRCLILIQLG